MNGCKCFPPDTFFSWCPPRFTYRPCRLGNESWKGEPVVVLVLFEVGKGDEEEAIEKT